MFLLLVIFIFFPHYAFVMENDNCQVLKNEIIQVFKCHQKTMEEFKEQKNEICEKIDNFVCENEKEKDELKMEYSKQEKLYFEDAICDYCFDGMGKISTLTKSYHLINDDIQKLKRAIESLKINKRLFNIDLELIKNLYPADEQEFFKGLQLTMKQAKKNFKLACQKANGNQEQINNAENQYKKEVVSHYEELQKLLFSGKCSCIDNNQTAKINDLEKKVVWLNALLYYQTFIVLIFGLYSSYKMYYK